MCVLESQLVQLLYQWWRIPLVFPTLRGAGFLPATVSRRSSCNPMHFNAEKHIDKAVVFVRS